MSAAVTATLNTIREKVRSFLSEKNTFTNILETIEIKSNKKVSREYIFYGILGFLVLYLMVGWGNDLICNVIGFLYPAYASVKAIESSISEDDTKWLMYWCVYALFGILEFFSDILLFWIPFYSLSKCVFLLWVMYPGKTGGTYIIYNKFLKVFVLKHQTTIDNGIRKVSDKFDKVSKGIISEASKQE